MSSAHDGDDGPREQAPVGAPGFSMPGFRVPGFWVRGAIGVVVRPHLWVTAARQVRRLARPRWWTRPPFLPVPDADYVEFRLRTQYGSGSPDARDVVAYLEWCRAMDHLLDHGRD